MRSIDLQVLFEDMIGPLMTNYDKTFSTTEMERFLNTAQDNYIKQMANTFEYNDYNSLVGNYESDDPIDTIFCDSKDQIWIGSRFGNSYVYDIKNQSCNQIMTFNNSGETSLSLTVNKFFEEKSGLMFVGTNLQGVVTLSDKAPKFKIIRYKNKKNNRNVNNIVSIFGDSNRNIWMKNKLNGAIKYIGDSQVKYFDSISDINEYLSQMELNENIKKHFSSKITVVFKGKNNTLWIGTETEGLFKYNKKIIKNYKYSISDVNSISSNSITTIHESKSGNLWIGTIKGLNKLKLKDEKFIRFYKNDGLLNNHICSILEDKKENLWVSTKQGMNKLNILTGSIDKYDKNNGIGLTSFNNNSKYISNEGEMFFGTKNGVVRFFPQEIIKNKYIPRVLFTRLNFLDKNKSIDIVNQKSISLDNKNSFRIYFTSLNYLFSESNNYAYKLEGRDQKWNYLNNTNNIEFVNLNPGQYKLKIKGSNNDLIWNEKESEIGIIVITPFWSSIWIKLIIFIFSLISILFILIKRNKEKLIELKTKEEIENFLNKYKISAREKEIINLIVQGKSNKDIEKELFISLGTVKNHIHNIFKKLNIKSRAKLIKIIVNQN